MPTRRRFLGDPALNERLTRFVRARLDEADAHDVVQSTLAEALAAKNPPESDEELTKWVFGIARHEIADHFRKRRREVPSDLDDVELEAPPSDGGARGILHWAKGELPPGSENEKTLEWMLREGDGEKLEHIAEESAVPAARVRKRVSRMRQHFRVRWAAAVAALVVVVVVIAFFYARSKDDERVAPVPSSEKAPPMPSVLPPAERARELRELAFGSCDRLAWQECLDRLDQAKVLDPDGDSVERVQNARKAAASALRPPPLAPPPSAAPAPTPTVIPTVMPTSAPTAPRPRSTSTFGTGSGP